jgi:hypothetical protein
VIAPGPERCRTNSLQEASLWPGFAEVSEQLPPLTEHVAELEADQ